MPSIARVLSHKSVALRKHGLHAMCRNQKPETSIIIPTFNRQAVLRGCLEALRHQTLPFDLFEVIVVDDGSTVPVDVKSILPGLKHSKSGLQVRVIRQANAGPAAARNRGAQEATGDLLAFIDDDCQPKPDWIETLVSMARQHQNALIGGSTRNTIDDNVFAVTNQLILELLYTQINIDQHDCKFLASNNWICRRDLFLEIGGFRQMFRNAGGEDRDFCQRWRDSNHSIISSPGSKVDHFHYQNLRQFLGMHYRYGAGAFIYHTGSIKKPTTRLKDTIAFHATLPVVVPRYLCRYPNWWWQGKILLTLVLSQLATAVGFINQAFCRPNASA